MDNALLASVLKALEITVFERKDKDVFRLLGIPPDWFKEFFKQDKLKMEYLNPGEKFPFLENFLIDAEYFWDSETTGCLRSGLWIETDASGKEYTLEASAILINKTKILMIRLASYYYHEKQQILQHGRELKLAYSRMEKLKGKLSEEKINSELANIEKSAFLANVSHEILNPLNIIIGLTELLQEKFFGDLTERQAIYVSNINRSTHYLLQLTNNILDISKIEAKKMPIHLSEVMIKELLEHCVTLIQVKASSKGINIDIQIPNELENLTVLADETKIKQVIENLLSNAVKYTPQEGSILVKAGKKGRELIISVTDNGIGIKPEDQERIFLEFEQIDSKDTEEPKGTGLGLSLAKKLVELHHGKIWVESAGEFKGSTFSFSIPLKPNT